MYESVRDHWWQRTWVVVLFCIFVPPVGIVLLWVCQKGNLILRFMLTIILLFCSVVWIGSILIGVTANNGVVEEVKPEVVVETPVVVEQEESKVAGVTPIPGTNEKVNEISRQAKIDAVSMDDVKRIEAVGFIRDNFSNYFKDNETMEKVMYYGWLLEYSYEKDTSMREYAKLGTNTYQAVKYVYRGYESINAESTTINLQQIQKSLNIIV